MYEPKTAQNKWVLQPDKQSLLWYTPEKVQIEVGYWRILVAFVKKNTLGKTRALLSNNTYNDLSYLWEIFVIAPIFVLHNY